MKCAAFLLIFVAVSAPAEQQPPTAVEIMRRAAENMDHAQAERARYVYDQNVFVRMKRANGKTAREESREYVVVPGEKGAKRKMMKLDGKVIEGKKEIPYSDAKFRIKKMDIDGELTDSFAHDLLWARHGKVDWFPIHGKNLDRYTFTLDGTEKYREYDVWRISYREIKDDDGDPGCWTGEALIDRSEFEPVLLTSSWDCKIPVAVKMLLGINVHHIGAKITFRRFDKEVWFPVSCGGEMKLRIFFMYARTIAFSGSAGNFRKADVQSSIQFEGDTDQ
jgi:hypothetical protein